MPKTTATPKTKTKKAAAKVMRPLEPAIRYILLVGSLLGLAASFILSYDKLRVLENPNFVPNCNLNPVLSCKSVMLSDQANAFGFPNPWIGLFSFGCLLTVAVALFAGAKFARWFWLTMYAGIIAGLGFAIWLLLESIYNISALCPYCLLTDVAVLAMFWYTTLYLFETRMLMLPARLQSTGAFLRKHHLDIYIGVILVVVVLILHHFWYYYGQYF